MMNRIIFGLIFLAAIINCYLIKIIYDSYVNQKFLSQAYYGIIDEYSNEDIFSISSILPNISVSTVPIEVLKAQVLLNNGFRSDTLLEMLDLGEKANPYLQYSNSLRSIYYANKKNLDSLKKYSKIAYYNMPNHTLHFNVYLDVLDYTKDTLELEKAFKEIKNPRIEFTNRYLKSLTKIKNKFSKANKTFVDSLNQKILMNNYFGLYSKVFEIGKENILNGITFSEKGENYFRKKNYIKAAESYVKALKFNPLENSYYENAANSYMQAGQDDKAIKILLNQLDKLKPVTGKSEYLLGILYIGKKENEVGCDYLFKSRDKEFVIPELIFDKFCD